MATKQKYNDNNRAIAYYRYSSHAQNDASIEQQQAAARKYAAEHGYEIVREYKDKAVSGRTDDRDDYQRMLGEINKLKPAVLILWKTDRLARDRIAAALAKKTIRDAGCSIHYISGPAADNSPESSLIEGVLEAFDEFYSANLRQNIIRGMHYNAEQALSNGRRILGYNSEEGKKRCKRIIVDPDTAPIVQRIFADYIDGKPMQQIADELNAQGLRSVKGNPFTINSLRRILHNETYTGRYKYGDIIVPDGIPALITPEQYAKAQERLAANKRTAAQNTTRYEDDDAPRYWLTGKLYCGHCKSGLQGVSGKGKCGTIYYYYSCANYRRHKCKLKPVRKDWVERVVIDVLSTYLCDEEKLASLAVDTAAYYKQYHEHDHDYINLLRGELKSTEQALGNLVKALEMGIFSDTTQARLMELEAQKKDLTAAIEHEQMKIDMLDDDFDYRSYYNQFANADLSDPEIRQRLLDYFVDKIFIYDDRIEIVGFYGPDRTRVDIIDPNETFGWVVIPDSVPYVEGFDDLAHGSTS